MYKLKYERKQVSKHNFFGDGFRNIHSLEKINNGNLFCENKIKILN